MESSAAVAAPPEATEDGLTRFVVLTGSEDLMTWTFVGTQDASSRDAALRKQFGKTPPLAVAVSETAWKPRRPKIVPVVRGLRDVAMPSAPASGEEREAMLAVGVEQLHEAAEELVQP